MKIAEILQDGQLSRQAAKKRDLSAARSLMAFPEMKRMRTISGSLMESGMEVRFFHSSLERRNLFIRSG